MTVAVREPFHYRHRVFFTGLFILIPLILVPALIVATLIKDEMFRKWRVVYVCYENAQGLRPGNAVNLRGIKIGHVRDVYLDAGGKVIARLNVNSENSGMVKKTSVARLKQKNFVVGDWEIDLSVGGEYEPAVQEGDTLPGICPIQMDATIGRIAAMVESADSLMTGIRNGEGLLGELLSGDSLFSQPGSVIEQSLTMIREINSTIRSANEMINKLAMFGESGRAATDSFRIFSEEARSMIGGAEHTFALFDTLALNLQPVPAGAEDLVAGLAREVNEADTLIQALKEHWLFRRQIKRMREGR
jgi:phospholipid/cholesterol/gamma-HCH transport system substrate-binding protein